MNSLSLRISKAGINKSKNTISFAPVPITNWNNDGNGSNKNVFDNFITASNSDEQLTILKNIFDELNGSPKVELIRFLVTVNLQADAKHPVKCFITRQISKRPHLVEPYADMLAQEIKTFTNQNYTDYKDYVVVVNKVATCIENFTAGSLAIKKVDVTLVEYLEKCLACCLKALRETSLAPTEKNDIFNLSHLVLRLLLYIIQKIEELDVSKWNYLLTPVKDNTQDLLFHIDVPMDTKSVCGILYLTIYVLENGLDSWLDALRPRKLDTEFNILLEHDASQLALYSAIPTVVSADKLCSYSVGNEQAVTVLTQNLLQIGERSSSESIFILGVTRTLLQISKALDKVNDRDVGSRLMELLLDFIWSHLEHYMDSVRHLTSQMLGCVVKYCTRLKKLGDEEALNKLISSLNYLDKARKSYYFGLCSLSNELGATGLMRKFPNIICEVLEALNVQAVQASATTALEALLQKHIELTSTEEIYKEWIEPIIKCVTLNDVDSSVLSILENLMAKAVKKDESIIRFIIPHIKESSDFEGGQDLKCALMLLSVISKSGVASKLSVEENDSEWKGLISYEVLRMAAVDAVDETRILSLSLIVESPKTTEAFAVGDLSFVLWYLRYNINAQAPNFRQHTLSLMKKFIKRLDESYKVLIRQRQRHCENYLSFLEELRRLCFDSLVQGANYSRRYVALQSLVWCGRVHIDRYERSWCEEYIEKLLLHLEDSYENNKQFALEILEACPPELIKIDMYSISLTLDDVVRQASSLKPTECVSAAYKLDLIRKKLPENILKGITCDVAESVTYKLLEELVKNLRRQVLCCHSSVVCAARDAPMYGILHCIEHLLNHIDPRAICDDESWSRLIGQIIDTCIEVNASVACVVNNSSPEGHLPMDMSGVQITDHGNSGGIKLDDGRPVTAQMVLLCAWRSVKEVSLLLGTISSRLTIVNEGQACGTLTADQMCLMGEHFTKLLAETKHRGAFEQAYVGFTRLLTRLWQCRSPELHGLPHGWLSHLIASISSGESSTLCATRRSAGLPFMIQALVTSEVQARGNGKSLEECILALMSLCSGHDGTPEGAERRAHCLNVLRALYRHSALHQHVAPHVGTGLRLALQGFDSNTWMERNSSTLLFSALMVRIFGVQRSRDAEQLCLRNRMTARIFFLRYPHLYDFILGKLEEVSRSEDTKSLCPSLYPILLLLARLYPSSLEGTVSNLKLVAFVPHLLACAKSNVMKTRELAARAMVPLISPEQYLTHLEAMLTILQDKGIKRNYCHGILMQLSRLIEARPDVKMEESMRERLSNALNGSLWILEEGPVPCWLLIDEYIKMVNFVLWKLPEIIDKNSIDLIERSLSKLIFNTKVSYITSGREICLSDALYLSFITLHKLNKGGISALVYRSLAHTAYEVVLAVLNYLLILYRKFDIDNKFQQHILDATSGNNVISELRQSSDYMRLIREIFNTNAYLECRQKSLRILVLENEGTQKCITDGVTSESVVKELLEKIYEGHENLTHVYLESLSMFVGGYLGRVSSGVVLDVVRVLFDCSTADNNDSIRGAVVTFLEKNFEGLMCLNLDDFSDEDKFEYKATLFATIAVVLEDDSDTLRQRTANTILAILQVKSHVTPSKCCELLRDHIERCEDSTALFVMFALLDFKSEVCVTDEVNDECRVFDQNERYNVFLEETLWTKECCDRIIRNYNGGESLNDFVLSVIDHPKYKRALYKLCNNNIVIFKNMLEDNNSGLMGNDMINPKINFFVNKLSVK